MITYRIKCPNSHHFYRKGSSSYRLTSITETCPVCRTKIILSGIVDEKIPMCPEDEGTSYANIVEDILYVVAMSWDSDTSLTSQLLTEIVCKTYKKVVKGIKGNPYNDRKNSIIQETQDMLVDITDKKGIEFNVDMKREKDYPDDLGSRKLTIKNRKLTSSILTKLNIIRNNDDYNNYLKKMIRECNVKL